MRHALTAIMVLALAAACATPGLPPGGPTSSSYPRVIATLPETGAVNVRPGRVLVRYDDVIGEQAGSGPLSRVVLISPWDGEPKVSWRRTGMAIAPNKGWRANTAYTITILPGVSDIKGKASPYGYVLRFSTGGAIPTSVLRGVAFDWIAGRSLPSATVQALDVRDTTIMHVTVADSVGRFEIGAIPPGTYLVRAVDEKSPNRTIDPREPWDSVRVTVGDSARTELYVFVHDTMPARIDEIRSSDSVTITIRLDKPLLPGASPTATNVRVVKADSSVVAVQSIMSAAEADSIRAREDSIARAKDTTATPPDPMANRPRNTIDPNRRRDTMPTLVLPEPKRKPPVSELVIKVGTPLLPGTTYRVSLTGLRNLMNRAGDASRVLIMPKATPPDSTQPQPGARRDSTTRRPPGPPANSSTGRPPRPPR